MKRPGNQILVIFGGSGDLTERKLLPALFDLYKQDMLPEKFAILGIGRTELSDHSFREKMRRGIEKFANFKACDKGKACDFLDHLSYTQADSKKSSDFEKIAGKLNELNESIGSPGCYIYYLATPPSMYKTIATNLAEHKLNVQNNNNCRKLIVEKPFGTDLKSAIELNKDLQKYFDESQIYRIDHYLGKETVQNLLVTRFSNGMFEPLWNRNYIQHIEITSAEKEGIGTRGGYYDQSGALRDMLQNHLLQIVGLVGMEPPTILDSDNIRNESVKVLQALRPFNHEELRLNVIRGQYTESTIRGEKKNSYHMEDGVDEKSRTETYVAMKFYIDNWRWGGVPFYVRTGKNLPTRVTEVVIHFKPSPHQLFKNLQPKTDRSNQLIIRIQPDEGILLKFGMKIPGAGFHVQDANMDFHYNELPDTYVPTSYERLLLDCMLGDSTLYARADAVEAAWKFVDPVLEAWKNDPRIPLHGYPAGTWGPIIADDIIEGDYNLWRQPCKNLANDGEYCEL